MRLYIIDIGGIKEDLPEEEYYKADLIFYHRDLIRGFSLNPITMNLYYNQMNQLIGDYVILEIFDYEVKEGLTSSQYEEFALDKYKELVEEGFTKGASTCLELNTVEMDNGGFIIYTEAMIEFSTSIYEYENILDEFMILYSPIMRYVYNFSNNRFKNFIDSITSGIINFKINKDIFDASGRYVIDPYGVFKYFLEKFLWLN